MSTNNSTYQNDDEKAVVEEALARHREKKSTIQQHIEAQEKFDKLAGGAMSKSADTVTVEEQDALRERVLDVLRTMNS